MSDKFRDKYRIPSSRLQNWDYSSNGYYFITICTKERQHYFGEIINDVMCLSKIGEIVKKYWIEIPIHFSFVELDKFVIMPNHVHGIVIIKNTCNDKCKNVCRDVINHVSTEDVNKNRFSKITPMNKHSLGKIIRWLKGRTTFEIKKIEINFVWQSRFYDHIIRDEKSFNRIREYVRNNPLNWEKDRNNSEDLWS